MRRLLAVLGIAVVAAAQAPPVPPPPAPPLAQRLAGLRRALAGAEATAQATAADELAQLGAAAVPTLVELLGDPKADVAGRSKAAALLAALGAEAGAALEPLVDALADPAMSTQHGPLLTAIGRIGPYCPEAAPAIALRLGNECDAHKYFGGEGFFATLSRLHFDASRSPGELLTGLTDANPFVRELAAEALARAWQRQPPKESQRAQFRTALLAALDDDHPRQFKLEWQWNGRPASTGGGGGDPAAILDAVAAALAVLQPDEPRSLRGHRQRLHHTDPRQRIEAVRNLGALGAEAGDAAPDLVALLDGELHLAREAATALGQIGSDSDAVRAALTRAAAAADKQLAARAAAALRQLPAK